MVMTGLPVVVGSVGDVGWGRDGALGAGGDAGLLACCPSKDTRRGFALLRAAGGLAAAAAAAFGLSHLCSVERRPDRVGPPATGGGKSIDEIVDALAAHDGGGTCCSQVWRLEAVRERIDAEIA